MVGSVASSSARSHGVDFLQQEQQQQQPPAPHLQQQQSQLQRPAKLKTKAAAGQVEVREVESRVDSDDSSSRPSVSASPSPPPGPSPSFKSMFKAPDHQVAGHQARAGQLGPLVDDSGRFYKPLQDGGRGSKELSFYRSFSSNPRVPKHIHRFFPTFHGTQIVEASDGSGPCLHLVLEDAVSDLKRPSLADVKIGSRTWYPHASEDYIAKCAPKDKQTTSLLLGFRISGLQVYQAKEGLGFWKPAKKHVQSFSVQDVRLVLRKFVSSNPSSDSEPDCAFAAAVYGGSDGILEQLLELKAWFEDQTIFHFYSVSVLMAYEDDTAGSGRWIAKVKLVDFAHVFDGDDIIDHNFLGGLCSLIKLVSEILDGPDAHVGVADGQFQEPKENQSCIKNGGQA